MKILFRADGNNSVGFGHLIRCISIIDYIYENRGISRDKMIISGNLSITAKDILEKNRITYRFNEYNSEHNSLVSEIQEISPDVLFIDKQFNYSKSEIENLKTYQPTIVMHNLCEGAAFADTFILPTAHTPSKKTEAFLTNSGIVKSFIGAEYIVLNSKILALKTTKKENKSLKLSVITGGTDPRAVMITLLNHLANMNLSNVDVSLLYGSGVSYMDDLMILKETLPNNFEVKPFNVEDMANSDLAICTFGISTYELLFLGIPVISVSHAPLNAEGSKTLAKRHGVHIDLGMIDDIDCQSLEEAILRLSSDKKLRSKFSNEGKELVDGEGVRRVADIILNFEIDEK